MERSGRESVAALHQLVRPCWAGACAARSCRSSTPRASWASLSPCRSAAPGQQRIFPPGGPVAAHAARGGCECAAVRAGKRQTDREKASKRARLGEKPRGTVPSESAGEGAPPCTLTSTLVLPMSLTTSPTYEPGSCSSCSSSRSMRTLALSSFRCASRRLRFLTLSATTTCGARVGG